MLSLNPWSIFWTIVNVLVLYLAMKKFLIQPVMNILNTRDEMIKKQFDGAKEAQEHADEIKAEYQEKLENAHVRAEEIVTAAKARAEEEYQGQIERAREDSKNMLLKAKRDIQNEQERAQQEAQAQIAELAIAAARKIMKTGEFNDAVGNE